MKFADPTRMEGEVVATNDDIVTTVDGDIVMAFGVIEKTVLPYGQDKEELILLGKQQQPE